MLQIPESLILNRKVNMHYAAESGCLKRVIDLHERGISLDICDDHQNTPLHYAAKHGHFEVAAYLIGKKCSLNIANSDGNTPLSIAVLARHFHVVDLLLDSGAVASLHLASRTGWLDRVKSFVASGKCDINTRNSDGETPLMLAASYEHKDVVEFLIRSGADANCLMPRNVKHRNLTILHYACGMDWFDVVKTVVETNQGVDIDMKSGDGYTPLAIAVRYRALRTAEFLIRLGADIDFLADEDNWKYLIYTVCQKNCPNIVRTVVENYPGFDVDLKCQGVTPLLLAASLVKKDVVNLFLELGADINAHGSARLTLLHFSCIYRWLDVIKKCIEGCAGINAQSDDGFTPLHLACREGDLVIMKLLLDAGADLNIRNIKGDTALNVVLNYSDCRCPDLVRLLMDQGAIFEHSDYELTCRNEDLKRSVLGDVDICSKAFINKYNNVDLPSIYRIPSSVKLPSIKKLKIKVSQDAAREIEKFVANEVEAKGFCNVVEKCPLVLQILSVRSFMNYYKNRL